MFTMVLSLSPTIWGNHRLDFGRWTHVMGIINVTHDSFSGDGLLENTDRRSRDEVIHDAVTLALQWVNEGPVIVDVGGDFFFQAEDGIRVYKVTGVQTCALPI